MAGRAAWPRKPRMSDRRANSNERSARNTSPATATDTIAALHHQAEVLRAELRMLRDELALAQGTLTSGAKSDLLDVNEHLTLTALYADRIASKAINGIADLIHASQHDVLTATPNRALGRWRMQQEMEAARTAGHKVVAVFIDIDDFKLINDSLGHAVGDQVLVMVARRLEAVVRACDLVCRFGGEEFLVVLGRVPDAATAGVKAEAMLTAVGESNEYGVSVSISLGIALFPDDGDDLDMLIAKADAAMYRAKRSGGGRCVFSGDEQRETESPRHLLTPQEQQLRDLREANEALTLAVLNAQEPGMRTQGQVVQTVASNSTVGHEHCNR